MSEDKFLQELTDGVFGVGKLTKGELKALLNHTQRVRENERQKFQEAVELLKREVDRRHFLNKLPMMTQKRIKVIIAVRELADEVFAEWLKGVKKK